MNFAVVMFELFFGPRHVDDELVWKAKMRRLSLGGSAVMGAVEVPCGELLE